jgi:hypothetical protein
MRTGIVSRVLAWSQKLPPPHTFEYALIILLIGAIVFAMLLLFGGAVDNVFCNVTGVLV